jgi:hypothetical protein
LKTKLNNAFVAGENKCPRMLESALPMLSQYMKDKGIHMTEED